MGEGYYAMRSHKKTSIAGQRSEGEEKSGRPPTGKTDGESVYERERVSKNREREVVGESKMVRGRFPHTDWMDARDEKQKKLRV